MSYERYVPDMQRWYGNRYGSQHPSCPRYEWINEKAAEWRPVSWLACVRAGEVPGRLCDRIQRRSSWASGWCGASSPDSAELGRALMSSMVT